MFKFLKTLLKSVVVGTLKVAKTILKYVAIGAWYSFLDILRKVGEVLRVLAAIGAVAAIALHFTSSLMSSDGRKYEIQKIKDLPPMNYSDWNRTGPYLHQAIIRLHDEKLGFICTAFVVSDKYAVTAAHCLKDIPQSDRAMRNTELMIFNDHIKDTGVRAKAAGLVNSADLGLILGDFREFQKLLLPKMPLSFAQGSGQYVSCGYPRKDELMCTPVGISGNYNFMVAAKGFLYPGMSGGPVVDMRTGMVMGVNSAAGPGLIIFAPLIGLFNNLDIKEEK